MTEAMKENEFFNTNNELHILILKKIFKNKKVVMHYHDLDHKFFNLQETRELYYLLTGLSYTEIGINFYNRNKYKFIYRIKKIMKEFNVQNRRQLAYFAVKEHLVQLDKIGEYMKCLKH